MGTWEQFLWTVQSFLWNHLVFFGREQRTQSSLSEPLDPEEFGLSPCLQCAVVVPWGWGVPMGGWWQFPAAEAVSLSAWMAFLFFGPLNFAGRSDCRSSVEMANLMVSKTSKHLISSHPTLCGGFLLVLLMTFIAVANRERAKKKKETCYFCCHRDISCRRLNWRTLLLAITLPVLSMHAPPNFFAVFCKMRLWRIWLFSSTTAADLHALPSIRAKNLISLLKQAAFTSQSHHYNSRTQIVSNLPGKWNIPLLL